MALDECVSVNILFNLSSPSVSDSEGAQGTARRELAAAKLHRRHPHEHHRAAPRASGGAQVRRRRNASNWTFSMIARRRASRTESDETMTETKKQTDWEEVTVWYRSAIHHHHYRCCTRARTPHTHDVMNCDTKKFNDSQSRRSVQTFPVLEQPNLLIHINYYYYNNRSVALMCLYNRVYTAAIPPLHTLIWCALQYTIDVSYEPSGEDPGEWRKKRKMRGNKSAPKVIQHCVSPFQTSSF